MLVKAIQKGYYNKAIVEAETIFNYEKDSTLPAWVEICEKPETQVNEKTSTGLKVSELTEEQKKDIIKRAKSAGITSNLNNYKVETLEAKIANQLKAGSNETKLLEELENLRTEALDKDIVVDVEGKSIAEEVVELKKALKK